MQYGANGRAEYKSHPVNPQAWEEVEPCAAGMNELFGKLLRALYLVLGEADYFTGGPR